MKGLIIVDIQYDFCPGGALGVPEGDAVIPIINALSSSDFFDLIVATQDWHPADHLSFASQHTGKKPGDTIELNGKPQVLWPDHCVQNTHGARLHDALEQERIRRIFQKGQKREVDSYSGFYDNDHKTSSGLGEYLKEQGITRVYLCGIATDYCVKYSALDARSLGFEVSLIEDASRGVNLQPDDVEKAVEEMRAAGVRVCQSSELIGNRSKQA